MQYFESRIIRLEQTLAEKMSALSDERNKVKEMHESIEKLKSALRDKDSNMKEANFQLDKLRRAFGVLAKDDARDRTPRHIETLQRSRDSEKLFMSQPNLNGSGIHPGRGNGNGYAKYTSHGQRGGGVPANVSARARRYDARRGEHSSPVRCVLRPSLMVSLATWHNAVTRGATL